jgi:hypothetical protein
MCSVVVLFVWTRRMPAIKIVVSAGHRLHLHRDEGHHEMCMDQWGQALIYCVAGVVTTGAVYSAQHQCQQQTLTLAIPPP